MPLHLVQQDIAEGRMVELKFDDTPRTGFSLAMCAVYPASALLGPAARWFVEYLKVWSEDVFPVSEQI
jgi:DNA-binding transcriptional LysR family regulator